MKYPKYLLAVVFFLACSATSFGQGISACEIYVQSKTMEILEPTRFFMLSLGGNSSGIFYNVSAELVGCEARDINLRPTTTIATFLVPPYGHTPYPYVNFDQNLVFVCQSLTGEPAEVVMVAQHRCE
jgi:hypothetical protein